MASRWAYTTSNHIAEHEVLDSHLDVSFGTLDDEAHLLKSSIALQMSVCILHKATYRIEFLLLDIHVTSKHGTGKDHTAGHAYIYLVTGYRMQQDHTTGAQACLGMSVCRAAHASSAQV